MTETITPPMQRAGSGFAVTSLVLGIIGLVGLIFVFSVPAIIFGGIGLARANNGRASGKGMAIAGLVLGIIGTLLSLLFIAVIVTLQISGFDWTTLSPEGLTTSG